MEAINKDYVLKLKEGICEYNGRRLRKLLKHLRKYGKMNDIVHKSIMERFREASDTDLPSDKYLPSKKNAAGWWPTPRI